MSAGNDSESEEWEFLTHSRAASPAICVPQISGEPLFDEDLLSLSHGRKGVQRQCTSLTSLQLAVHSLWEVV